MESLFEQGGFQLSIGERLAQLRDEQMGDGKYPRYHGKKYDYLKRRSGDIQESHHTLLSIACYHPGAGMVAGRPAWGWVSRRCAHYNGVRRRVEKALEDTSTAQKVVKRHKTSKQSEEDLTDL
jgi:hypothetical protein